MRASLQADEALSEAADFLRNGDLVRAETKLGLVLNREPAHPVALYMMGNLHLRGQSWPKAETCLRHALAQSPGQPMICLHLGLVLRAQGRPTEAVGYCRIATEGLPEDLDAWAELAKAEEECGLILEAEKSYRHMIRKSGSAWARENLAALLNRCGRSLDAESLLRPTVPDTDTGAANPGLTLQLAISLRLQGRHHEALEKLSHGDRDTMLERANLAQHLGQFADAIATYRSWLADHPQDLEMHLALNELLYRQNEQRDMLSSYEEARVRSPGDCRLPCAHGLFLLKLGRFGEAREMFERALHIAPSDGPALMGHGRALEALGQMNEAALALEKCVTCHPENTGALEALAAFQLRRGDSRHAQSLVEQALRRSPHSQGALALLGLCYRAQNDDREQELNAYETFVQIFDLEAPEGFSSMSDFNHELAAYLESLHRDDREYPHQTVRGGKQLHDAVFYNGHPLVDRLLPSINGAVRSYVSRLKTSNRHPLASRCGRGFRYAGSWSSRLKEGGFHVNHIHQKGWISSCYYVAVPRIAGHAEARQGWIKFGEPSEDFGDRFPPRLSVEPRPGRLVLFPSYVWHGTNAFHSPQARTTIAFDAVPVG